METESESIDIATIKREVLRQSQDVSRNERLEAVRHAFQRVIAASTIDTRITQKAQNTSDTILDAQERQDVIDPQSLPELASTVPDSQAIDDIAIFSQTIPASDVSKPVDPRGKMSSQSSVPHDTQPVSQSIFENIITRVKAVDDGHGGNQHGAGNSITQGTLNEGDEGHVDLLSSFRNRDYSIPDGLAFDPNEFSPSEAQQHLPHFPESQRYRTPVTTGKKRKYDGQLVETPSVPRNPMAANKSKSPGQVMGLSQAFAATQAASSPLLNVTLSDPLSDRPSPNIQVQARPVSASLSSPLLPGSGLHQTTTEPYSRYVSMKQSQAERERLAELKHTTSPEPRDEDSDEDEFDMEPSLVERRRRLKERDEKVRYQFEAVSSPSRSRSKGRTVEPLSSPRRQLLSISRTYNKQPNHNCQEAGVEDDDISDDGVPDGSLSEEETEQEGDVEITGKRFSQLARASEEDKENNEYPCVQIPDTSTRLQSVLGGSGLDEASPSLRHKVDGNLGRGHLSDGLQEHDGSQPFVVANSQPSQLIHRRSTGPNLEIPSSSEDPPFVSHPQFLLNKSYVSSSPARVEESSPKVNTTAAEQTLDGTAATFSSLHNPGKIFDDDEPILPLPEEDACGDHRADDLEPIEGATSQSRRISKLTNMAATDFIAQNQHSESGITVEALNPIPYSSPLTPNRERRSLSPVLPLEKLSDAASSSKASTNFETAQTHLPRSSVDQLRLLPKPSTIMASPSGRKRRMMTEIATDPSPREFCDDPDMDEAMAVVDNRDFEEIIGSSSPIGPGRNAKRRRPKQSLDPVPEHIVFPIVEHQTISLPETRHGRETKAVSEQDVHSAHHSDVQIDGNISARSHPATLPMQDGLITAEGRNSTQSTRSKSRPSVTCEPFWEVQPSPQRPTGVKPRALETKGRKLSFHRNAQETSRRLSRPTLRGAGVSAVINSRTPDPLVLGAPTQEPSRGSIAAPADEIEYPNHVLAVFNGNTRAYYPAKCVGTSGAPASRYQIQWEGCSLVEVDAHSVQSLDLRVGDSVKIDCEGFPKVPYIICELKNKVQPCAQNSDMTDIRGYKTLLVLPKQRKSLHTGLGNTDVTPREVPVSAIYLDSNMWNQMKGRDFVYKAPPATTQHLRTGIVTPSERPSTPSTPTSRSRRRIGLALASGSHLASASGIFNNMAFDVTGDDPKPGKSLKRLIEANGGLVLKDGFQELFAPREQLELEPRWAQLGFTALIADRHSRKAKYMEALALNLPCLSWRWIHSCIAKSSVVDWQPYLLAAGESIALDSATRSRILPAIDPATATLRAMIDTRPPMFSTLDSAIIVTRKGDSKDSGEFYVFLSRVMGLRNPVKSGQLKATKILIDGGMEKESRVCWVFVDDRDVDMAKRLLKTAGRRGDKGTINVVGKEFICQSLILGALCEQ